MFHPRTLLLAALSALLVLAVACGGDDDNPSTPTPPPRLTAEQADAVASAGLLTREDLPTADWFVEDFDYVANPSDSSDEDDMWGNTPACQDVAAALDELSFGDSTPLASKERDFNTGDGSLMMRSVTSSVAVPDTDISLTELFGTLSQQFSADSMRPCFESGLVSSLEEDPDLLVTRINVYTPDAVIEGGVAIGLDLEAVAVIVPIELKLQMHMWPEGPAAGNLIVMEMNSDLLTRNMADILETAQQRLADAVAAARE